MARKQSSQIWYQGVRHKEMYFQGHYHDEAWLNGVCIWKKLSGVFPSAVTAITAPGHMGKIGDAAYTVSCTQNTSTEDISITYTLYQAGAAVGSFTKSGTFRDYSGEGFMPAGHARGMLIAAPAAYYGRSVTDPVVYISKDGTTATDYTLPAMSTTLPQSALFARNSNWGYIDAGVIGDIVLLPGNSYVGSTGGATAEALKYVIIDTRAGSSALKTESILTDAGFYAAFFNDDYNGDLYALKVLTTTSSVRRVTLAGFEIVEILSASSSGLTERSLITLTTTSGSTSGKWPYLHAVNEQFFYRSGQRLYKISANGSDTNVLTLPTAYCCYVGDVVYNGSEYLVLTYNRTNKEWTGYRSQDGTTWTADNTVSDGTTARNTADTGSSVYADGGLYTGGWNGMVVYATQ